MADRDVAFTVATDVMGEHAPAHTQLSVHPSFRKGLPLNIALFTVGAFWLILGTVSAVNAHLLWTLIFCAVGFAFFAAPLLYYRNSSLWLDGSFAGKTDLLARRTGCARSELESVQDVRWITRRIRFLAHDGRLGFEINSYGWEEAEISKYREALGL